MNATLLKITLKTQDIKEFVLQADVPVSYVPGQYIMIQFKDETEKHAFSIVDYNSDNYKITIIVKGHGEFTSRLFKTKIGERFMLYGPYGRFTLSANTDAENSKKIVLIAGGIGITPIYSMASNNRDKNITVFYTVKEKSEAVLYDELKNMGIDVRLNCSKNDGRLGTNEVYCGDDALYYVCGPGAMIDQFRQSLIMLGVKQDNIRSEDFI